MRYDIYIEDYVLSYLKRETDSLELSEIFFYGIRDEARKKLFVYGAGRGREIEAFAAYELLDMLMCRLTQAGPVFMVRGESGDCEVNGFQIFYTNNEAMQRYLLEWKQGGTLGGTDARGTERAGRRQGMFAVSAKEQPERQQNGNLPSLGETPKKTHHNAMSIQLCLILVVLVAIVISSANSFDKMEQLNQSAKEVFFAIENQEAEDKPFRLDNAEAGQDFDENESAQGKSSDTGNELEEAEEKAEWETEKIQRETEVVVQKAATVPGETEVKEEGTSRMEDTQEESQEEGQPEDKSAEVGTEAAQSEGILKPVTENGEKGEEAEAEKTSAETEAEEVSDGKETQEESQNASQTDSEEALSRSITRYYEVEKGDTLYTISQKIYGDTSRVKKICELNEIDDPDKIRFGQKIILP